MTYLMSDVHGQFTLYLEMLSMIDFTDRDELYVLGDVVDRGPEPMALLLDMSLRSNVYPLLGNHDWTARALLPPLNTEITEESIETVLTKDFLEAVRLWRSDGGEETIRDFRRLSADDRERVLDYLDEFSPYEEIEVNGVSYVLVHAGLQNFDPAKPLDEYDILDFIDGRTDYTKPVFPDRILVTGHTPTLHVDPAYKGRIWRGNGHIALDCGAGFNLPLGCLRLEDGKEFYTEQTGEQ